MFSALHPLPGNEFGTRLFLIWNGFSEKAIYKTLSCMSKEIQEYGVKSLWSVAQIH
jgi:hypothetical protein